jgi:phage terminase large subunit
MATIKLPEVFTPLLDVRARYKAFYSGRGCGKSTAFAIATVLRAMDESLRIICVREVQKTIKESVKYDIEKVIHWFGLENVFHITANTITSAAGSHFVFEGLQSIYAARIQSLSDFDIVWVEEAQSISARSLNTLIPTIRKNGSELWFAWNPYSPKDPVDKMFRNTDIADQPVPPELQKYYDQWAVVRCISQADIKDLFPSVIKVEMERDRVRDPDLWRHVWDGGYSFRSDSSVFKNWRVGAMAVPNDATPYYGADWGFSIDPTVLVRCYLFPDDRVLYVDAEVGGVGIEIDKTPAFFATIATGPDDPLHPRLWPIMADSARPETISYVQRHGYPQIKRARKGPGSIEEGIEFIKSFDVLINPNCKRVIDEFTYYSFERDKKTEEILPKLEDDHNHTIDAVRYAVESARRTIRVSGDGFGAVSEKKTFFGDFSAQELQNPVLSPKQPGSVKPGREKGLVW